MGIPKEKKKKDNDSKDESQEKYELINRSIEKINNRITTLMVFQIIFVFLLVLILIFAIINFSSKGAVIDAGEGIKLDLNSVVENYAIYEVELELENTGDETAKISITGEVYISEMGSAYGDEATTVLEYKYVEIEPGETKDLDLGRFTVFDDWHYFIKVHVSWNGGSLELGKILIP